MRRSARRRWRIDVATDGRGRGPAKPGRAHERRPRGHQWRDPADRPRHRRRAPRQPDGVEQRRQRPADRRLRPAQPVPHHDPARDQRGLDRRRRLERMGGDQPPRQPHRSTGRQLRLAVLRGRRTPGRLRRGEPLHLREPLRRRHRRRSWRPYFRYHHNDLVLPNDVCPKGGSSVAGTSFAFSSGGTYPAEYRGALFFADYTRRCIWAIPTGTNGLPDISKRRTFVGGAAQPVDLEIGPGGDLFYVDIGGTIRRIRYFNQNQPPIAVAAANPTSGAAPLTVAFDGTASNDPDGDALTYAWDLDGDGAFDDAPPRPPASRTPSQARIPPRSESPTPPERPARHRSRSRRATRRRLR